MKGCRALTDDEVTGIRRSFVGDHEPRDDALFMLGVRTGLRITELLSLHVGDVLKHGRVTDRITIAGRTIALHLDAQDALLRWIEILQLSDKCEPSQCLFPSRKGKNRPISVVQAWRILNAAFKENDLTWPLGTHAMRKTFAHRIYERLNHDLPKTQYALRHKAIGNTATYLDTVFCVSTDKEDIDAAILGM